MGPLDYTSLPDVYSADGGSVSRDVFEATEGVEFCDDACQPASGGGTCSALSCYEVNARVFVFVSASMSVSMSVSIPVLVFSFSLVLFSSVYGFY